MACLYKKHSGVYYLTLFIDGKRVYKSTLFGVYPEQLSNVRRKRRGNLPE